MLLVFAFAVALSPGQGNLICRYDPDREGNQLVLRDDGSIRFVSLDTADKDSVMKADTYRLTASRVIYKLVMPGRTDTFEVSLKTLRGVQTLDHGPNEQKTFFRLLCHR